MQSSEIYYCWSCDAHRRSTPRTDGAACCPRCGTQLSEDARLQTSHGLSGLLQRLSVPSAISTPATASRAAA